MTDGSLYEKVLRQIQQGASPPRLRPPRPSAAVVLWRRRRGQVEVFWIKRSESLSFMAGFHAFPGGGLLRRDPEVGVLGRPKGLEGAPAEAALPEAVTEGVDPLGPILVDGLVVCALRELFEETGLLLASPPSVPELKLEAGRRQLIAEQVEFNSLLDGLGLELVAEELVYAGRWLTPPLGPLRFDNRFFLLEWPEARSPQPRVIPGEAESGEWIRPAEALDRWRAGEIVTAPPILHILQVLAEQGPHEGLARLREPTEMNLGPFRRIEFRPGVLLFPLRTPTLPPAAFTNAYLLGTGETVLVDPGSPLGDETTRLGQALRALESSGERTVTAIWLTHHHSDHVGGVDALRETLGVPVCAHRRTAEFLEDRGVRIDHELSDGQHVVLAGDPPFHVRVVHTPGHARGHLCFYDETFGSLLAGDLVAGFGTIVIDPPEGNMDEYLTSLRRVRDLEPRALFPAHGPPLRDGSARLEEYLRHRLWREQRILQAWQSGHRLTSELLTAAYEDVPAVAEPLAERQIVAHLERLRALGRLRE